MSNKKQLHHWCEVAVGSCHHIRQLLTLMGDTGEQFGWAQANVHDAERKLRAILTHLEKQS